MKVAGTAVIALAAMLAGCSTTKAPTYTAGASVKFTSCPRQHLRPRQHLELDFVVVNGSRGTWPATYVLLSLQGAAKGTLTVAHAPSQGIGGGIRRITSALRAGESLAGKVSAYLDSRSPGTVNVGAWGAPANSVAVPTSYPNPGCTLHP
jgi:hypothetical protein